MQEASPIGVSMNRRAQLQQLRTDIALPEARADAVAAGVRANGTSGALPGEAAMGLGSLYVARAETGVSDTGRAWSALLLCFHYPIRGGDAMAFEQFREKQPTLRQRYRAAWRRWKWEFLIALGILMLLLVLSLGKQAGEEAELLNRTAASPRDLFETVYPDGLYLGELTDGTARFLVGADDGENICWLLEETETGWRIQEVCRYVKTLQTEFQYPKSARVYACSVSDREILVIKKIMLNDYPASALGSEPSDTAGSVFSHVIDEGLVSQTYYYFTVADCDAPDYALTAW